MFGPEGSPLPDDLRFAGWDPAAASRGKRSGLFYEFLPDLWSAASPTVDYRKRRWTPCPVTKDGLRAVVVGTLAEFGYGVACECLTANTSESPSLAKGFYLVGCHRDPGRRSELLFELR